jgi:hypothetical protein
MLLLLLLLLHNERGAADVAAAALAAIRAPQPQTAARPSREKPNMIEAPQDSTTIPNMNYMYIVHRVLRVFFDAPIGKFN